MKRSNLPGIQICFNLKMGPSCKTLSNTFDMSRNTPQTSYPSSNKANIPRVIDQNRLMQESPDLKLD